MSGRVATASGRTSTCTAPATTHPGNPATRAGLSAPQLASPTLFELHPLPHPPHQHAHCLYRRPDVLELHQSLPSSRRQLQCLFFVLSLCAFELSTLPPVSVSARFQPLSFPSDDSPNLHLPVPPSNHISPSSLSLSLSLTIYYYNREKRPPTSIYRSLSVRVC